MGSPTLTQQFQLVLSRDGLPAAIQWLNRQVPYRFTAVFRFDGDMLRNICLADKQHPEVTRCGDQPITNSYCLYIHRTREEFRVEESLADQRLENHPNRQNYHCYYGIPLFDRDQRMVGTVCHFSTEPIRVTDNIATTLDTLATLIANAAFPSATK